MLNEEMRRSENIQLRVVTSMEVQGSKALKALQIFVQNNDCSGRC